MCLSNQMRGEGAEISCGCFDEKLKSNDEKIGAGFLEFNALERGQLLALSRRKAAETNEDELHKHLLISCCIRGVEREIDRCVRQNFKLF